jgi:5'-nucleotidase
VPGPRSRRLGVLLAALVSLLAMSTTTLAGAQEPADGGDPPGEAAQAPVVNGGYLIHDGDGGVYELGDAPAFPSGGRAALNAPIVGSAVAPGEDAYWQVASDGGVFTFGASRFFGSAGALPLNQPIVGMAATPSGEGYWLVASDGGVFSYGDADFFGSTGAMRLNQPIVGMIPTPSGQGYWLVASDGGIFSFGDADFFGSTGAITLNQPIVGGAGTPTGEGYWLVASDGGIFSFGDADFFGSGVGTATQRIVDIAATQSGGGYLLAGARGGVWAFGDAVSFGTATLRSSAADVVSIDATVGGATTSRAVDVQILGLNDFHGNIEPPAGSSGRIGTAPAPTVNAGGAAFLSTHIANLEATNPDNTIVVSAGDLIGASPLLSALFHDEPTIEAMNEIGLDLNAVGNHEFDEGTTELLRMQSGGCHPVDGCQDGTPFDGADFDFLAANVVRQSTGDTLFPPYTIENFSGARVAFIGMTLEGTPLIVSPSGVAGFSFRDEADTVNALVPVLQAQGVEAIVILLHEGASPAGGAVTTTSINECGVGGAGISGPVVDIVQRFDPAVDLVISGHTHQPYNCVVDGIPVTSAYSFGRLVTDVDMTVDRVSGEISEMSINNRIVTRDVTADPAITALIARYQAVAAPIANRVIGSITADITQTNDVSLEQPMGNAIADAQLEATDDAGTGAAVLSFMNPGGVRAPLTFSASAGGEAPGQVTYGELFTVQPFGNSLVTMDLTGAQIEAVLEQQFCGSNAPANGGFAKVLLPSAGFHYTYDSADIGAASCASADAIDPTSITLGGIALDLAATYRVTVNSFLADGGDGFPAFIGGTNRLGGAVDTDAFEAYLALGPLSPPATDRIDRI